jgi:hypothetical protein
MGKSTKIAIIAIVGLASGILLIFHGDALPQPWRTLVSFAYGALVLFFATRGTASLKGESGDCSHQPGANVRRKYD